MLFLGQEDVLLSTNRREQGLHYSGDTQTDNSHLLMKQWKTDYTNFSGLAEPSIIRFNYDGSLCSPKCCFNALCDNFAVKFLKNLSYHLYHKYFKGL